MSFRQSFNPESENSSVQGELPPDPEAPVVSSEALVSAEELSAKTPVVSRRTFRFSQAARPLLAEDAERRRLEAVERYQACSSLRGIVFDDLARLAAFICQTPISLVTLIDSKRQWFLSSTGVDICETSREVSFCAHALVGPGMLIVPDTRADARFADNPLVTSEPCVRFYAGAPLVTPDGYTLGTLCVLDRVPRTINREQKNALLSLSRLAITQLELHRLKHASPGRF